MVNLFFKQKTAYEMATWLEFRGVLFRSVDTQVNVRDRYGACAREPSPAGREAPLAAGRAAQVMGGTEVASRGGQPSPIQYPSTPQVPAPEGVRAVAAATAVRRPGRAAVGARRALRDPGRGGQLAPGGDDAPARRAHTARASRALRPRPAHSRPVPREHLQPREPRPES